MGGRPAETRVSCGTPHSSSVTRRRTVWERSKPASPRARLPRSVSKVDDGSSYAMGKFLPAIQGPSAERELAGVMGEPTTAGVRAYSCGRDF